MWDVLRLPNPWTVPVLTVPVAGDLVGVTRSAAYRMVQRGELPTIRMGGRLMVPTARLYERLGLPVPPRPVSPAAYRG